MALIWASRSRRKSISGEPSSVEDKQFASWQPRPSMSEPELQENLSQQRKDRRHVERLPCCSLAGQATGFATVGKPCSIPCLPASALGSAGWFLADRRSGSAEARKQYRSVGAVPAWHEGWRSGQGWSRFHPGPPVVRTHFHDSHHPRNLRSGLVSFVCVACFRPRLSPGRLTECSVLDTGKHGVVDVAELARVWTNHRKTKVWRLRLRTRVTLVNL